MNDVSSRRLLWLTLVGTIIWGAMMFWQAGDYHRGSCAELPTQSFCTSGLVGPTIPLEMTRSASAFQALVDQCNPEDNRDWNAEVVRIDIGMGFLFIGLYGSLFLLFARLLGGGLSRLLIIATLLTICFDVAENVCILQSLRILGGAAGVIHAPGVFATLKWSFSAVSVFVLGLMLMRLRRLSQMVMASLLIASSAAIVAALFWVALFAVALLLLVAFLLIGLVSYFPIYPFRINQLLAWIETIYLLRFQIVGGLLLAVVLPCCYFVTPWIFAGIFDALGFWSFVFVVWASLQLAWTVMITSRMVFVYGPDRYQSLKRIRSHPSLYDAKHLSADNLPKDEPSWAVVGSFGALALPCTVMTCCGTLSLAWWQKALGIAIAVSLTMTLLWLTARLHDYFEHETTCADEKLCRPFPARRRSKAGNRSAMGFHLDRLLQKHLPKDLKKGLLTGSGRLRSGHQLAATALLLFLFIYALAGICFSPISPWTAPAAIFFFLYMLILFTWTMSGLAFFFDLLRVPIFSCALSLSLLFGLFSTDHEFKTTNLSEPLSPPTPDEVIRAWELSRSSNGKTPIVVVASAGGGIRAAAWSAEVLTRLTSDCQQPSGQNPFASSLVLISSVSGGSKGAMYFAGAYSQEGVLDTARLSSIRESASGTSLSAVGWGFLYPDLLRTVPVIGSLSNLVIGHDIDRGWALEKEWIKNWDGHQWTTPPTIGDWIADVKNGDRPAVIFNATASETGQRFVIASTTFPSFETTPTGGRLKLEFADTYPKTDIPISTAARLSATFPWISPMARAKDGDLHFADGGYYDNSGVLSATEWLLDAREAIKDHPVLLILIDYASPGNNRGELWSWQSQFLAPISTLLSVRTSSQQLRAKLELDLARHYLENLHLNVTTASVLHPPDLLTSLSWHLTPQQQQRVGEAWLHPGREERKERKKIYSTLGCRVPDTK
jgi:Patatin-like phospholipase